MITLLARRAAHTSATEPPRRASTRRIAGGLAAVSVLAATSIGLPASAQAAATRTAVAAAPSKAASVISWSIHPASSAAVDTRPNFTYSNFEPGASLRDYVAVQNFGTVAETFHVYPADGYNTPNGGFGLLSASQKSTQVGAWVSLPVTSVKVPAGKSVLIPFSVVLPKNATPGYHVGGIVAALPTERSDGKGGTVKVEQGVASRIYLQAAGALAPSLTVRNVHLDYDNKLASLKGGTSKVSFTVANTGNVPLKGDAKVEVGGPFGMLSSTTHVSVPELLPGSSLKMQADVGAVFPAFHLSSKVTVTPQSTVGPLVPAPHKASSSAGAWAMPWLLLIIIAVIVALFFWRRRRIENLLGRAMRQGPGRHEGREAGGVDDTTAVEVGRRHHG